MTEPTDAQVEVALAAFYPANGNRPWPRVARDLMEAALAAAQAAEPDGPGTPIARLRGISEFAKARGLCIGIEAKAPELFLMEAFDRTQAQGFAAGIEAATQAGVALLSKDDTNQAQRSVWWQGWRAAIHDYMRAIRALRPPAAPAESEAGRLRLAINDALELLADADLSGEDRAANAQMCLARALGPPPLSASESAGAPSEVLLTGVHPSYRKKESCLSGFHPRRRDHGTG